MICAAGRRHPRRPDRLSAGRGALPRRRQRRATPSSSATLLAERLGGFRAILDDRSLATGPRRGPGPARGRDPGAADRRRPRRPALLRDRRGDGRRASPPSSPGPATPARTASRSSSRTTDAVELWDALMAAGRARRADAGRARRPRHAPARGRDAALRQRARRDRPTRTRPVSAGSSSSTRPATSSAAPRSSRSPPTGQPAARRAHRPGRGIARHGYPVYAERARDRASSPAATQSPTLGVPIAMAYVAPGDAEPGTMLDVGIRDARVPAEVVPLPFYSGPLTPTCRSSADGRQQEDRPRWCPRTCATPRTTSGSASTATDATIGITAYAADQLGDIVFVELPEVGRDARAERDLRRRRVGQGGQRPVRPAVGRGRRGQRRPGRPARARERRPVRRPAGWSGSTVADPAELDDAARRRPPTTR